MGEFRNKIKRKSFALGQKALNASGVREELDDIKRKLDESLHYVNIAKNADTVKVGEFEALTRIFTGQKMFVDTRDLSVAPHLMLDGVWEKAITDVWRSAIKEGDTVVDIGANFGWFGIVAGTESSLVSIHFIEANPHLCPYIEKSCNVNGLLEKSRIHNIALSDKPGKVKLNFLEDYWGSSSLHNIVESKVDVPRKLKLREKVDVNATTLDRFMEGQKLLGKQCLVKMDIEGYEEIVLNSSPKFLKAAKQGKVRMFIEFTTSAYKAPEETFKTLVDSFKVIQLIGENGRTKKIKSYKELIRLTNNFSDGWAMLYCY